MIRVISEGVGPQKLRYVDGMSAGSALADAGIAVDPAKVLAVDGRRASADTPVRAGSTVAQQPRARNG